MTIVFGTASLQLYLQHTHKCTHYSILLLYSVLFDGFNPTVLIFFKLCICEHKIKKAFFFFLDEQLFNNKPNNKRTGSKQHTCFFLKEHSVFVLLKLTPEAQIRMLTLKLALDLH